MTVESAYVGIFIDRPPGEVYDYVANPANLPRWAPGLATSVEQIDGRWVAASALGAIVVAFAPRNPYGVLDHDVTLPSGETVTNPMRVVPAAGGCEVMFTVRRQPGTSAADFDRDQQAVAGDLGTLKRLLEGS